MIALGLLAKHPEFRKPVMGNLYQAQSLGTVRVVAFTGRESDAPLGIWGSIAEQLGKKEVFKDYYAPLSAPGQTAWKNLLAGEPLLILLDELPPYFDRLPTHRQLRPGRRDHDRALEPPRGRGQGRAAKRLRRAVGPAKHLRVGEPAPQPGAGESGRRGGPWRSQPGARGAQYRRGVPHPAQAPLRG